MQLGKPHSAPGTVTYISVKGGYELLGSAAIVASPCAMTEAMPWSHNAAYMTVAIPEIFTGYYPAKLRNEPGGPAR